MKTTLISLILGAATVFAVSTDNALVLSPTTEQVNAAQAVGNKKCPISGNTMGTATSSQPVVYTGRQRVEAIQPSSTETPVTYVARQRLQGQSTVGTEAPVVYSARQRLNAGMVADGGVTVVYNGKAVKLCCASCVKAFSANPEKFLESSEHDTSRLN